MSFDILSQKADRVESDVRRARKPDSDYTEAMGHYHTYLRTHSSGSLDHDYAFRSYEDPLKREIIEALLLSGAEFSDVKEHLGIPEKSMEVYRELFFDTSLMLNRLDWLSYIEGYDNPAGKELKIRALNLGPEFIYFKYANVVPKTESQRTLVKKMFMASAYRAMEANYNSMNSNISRASLQWSQTMLKCYEAIEKLMGEDNADSGDLVTILTSRKLAETKPVEDVSNIV